MKRVLCLLLFISVTVSLCGCTPQSTAAAEYSAFLVSATGFAQKNDEITVWLEALVVNSEDAEAETLTELYNGSGKTVREAIHQASAAAAQPLHLGHCAAIILDSTVTAELFTEICSYCREQTDLSLAVAFCFTENTEKLLSCKSSSTVAMGYEIANMLTEQYSRSGIAFKNRFYELEAARMGKSRVFTLPNLTANGENCLSVGAMLFKDDTPTLYLNPEQTAVFALAVNRLKKGTVFIENKEFSIEKAKTTLEFKNENDLSAELKIAINSTDKPDLKILKEKITELYSVSKTKGIDIFFFADILSKKHSKLWKKYKDNFDRFYNNSEMAVVFK